MIRTLLRFFHCFGFHDLAFVKKYNGLQTWKVLCVRCNRFYAYKASGEYQGAIVPWNRDAEDYFEGMQKDIDMLIAREQKRII